MKLKWPTIDEFCYFCLLVLFFIVSSVIATYTTDLMKLVSIGVAFLGYYIMSSMIDKWTRNKVVSNPRWRKPQ